MIKLHQYKAVCDSVLDGDTVDLTISLGFKIYIKQRIRLAGIDAPETRTRDKKEKAKGLAVKEYVRDKIEGKDIILETEKQGKFGRYLGTIYYGNTNLNRELVLKGYVSEYWGGKR